MNRQPTSLVDFMTVVMAVEYPGLIETDRLILATIAVRADWHTGKHGFPGLDRLCLTTSGKDGRKDRRTIQRRLRWLESIRLIECTGYRRGGQGKATEYRICLEHAAFKEPFKEPPDDPDEERHNGAAVTDNLERHGPTNTAARGTDYSGTGSSLERHAGAAPSESSSEDHPTIHPTKAVRKTDGPLKGWEGWMESSETLTTMGMPNPAQKAWLIEAAAKIDHIAGDTPGVGWDTIKDAVYRWQQRRDQGMGGLNYPWLKFTGVGGNTPGASEGKVHLNQILESSDWKCKHVPGYQEFLDLSTMQIVLVKGKQSFRGALDMTDEERAAIQKVDDNKDKWDHLGVGSRLFLTKEDIALLNGMIKRNDEWQRAREKKEAEEQAKSVLEIDL